MIRATTIILFALGLFSCGEGHPKPTHPEAAAAPTDAGHALGTTHSPSPASRPPDASLAIAPVERVPAPDAALPEKEVVLVPSKRWPFYTWDKAQAFTFNLRRPAYGIQLHLFKQPEGWAEKPIPGQILTDSQTKKALQLLAKTQGAMDVSKCPFPRHGIVFYQQDVPVGSISVCFECGDILNWPAYSQDPMWEKKKLKRSRKLMRAYDRIFPRWKKLFADELGLATDWKTLPGQAP